MRIAKITIPRSRMEEASSPDSEAKLLVPEYAARLFLENGIHHMDLPVYQDLDFDTGDLTLAIRIPEEDDNV